MTEFEDSKPMRGSKSALLTTDQRFKETKTGLIGAQRETMLNSELQFLPQLGKSRTRGHRLPPASFIYGTPYDQIDGGVPEALSHWINQAKDSKTRDERYRIVKDYIGLNKAAAKSGCVNTKQNDQFRALNDIRKKVRVGGTDMGSAENGLSRQKTCFPADMTFGMPNRPSTPLHEVLEHRYLYSWLDDMQKEEAKRVSNEHEQSKAISGAYHTKSSWLKNAKIPVDERPLWKMPRFRNINPAVDSFRTQSQRAKALSAHQLDGVPRQGANVFKQGVYTVNTTSLPC